MACKGSKNPYNTPHTTTRRCGKRKTPVRRYFLLFNKPSDKLCGHWLMTSLKNLSLNRCLPKNSSLVGYIRIGYILHKRNEVSTY